MWLKLATHSCRLPPAGTGVLADARSRLLPQQQPEMIALIRRVKDEFTRYQRIGTARRYEKKVTDAAFTADAAITLGIF